MISINEFKSVFDTAQKNKPDNFPKKYAKYKDMYKKAKRFLKRAKGKRGLDVGCAHGSVTILAQNFGMKVVGLDITPSRYTSTQKKLKKMGYPIVMYSSLPLSMFKDNEFDFILMHYLKCSGPMTDDQRLKELSRIAKNGCTWYISPGKSRAKRNPKIKKEGTILDKKFFVKSS